MAQTRIGWRYRMLLGVGILIAAFTGIGSLLLGYPFLTTSFTYVSLPVIGKFELATAMLFDLGVFVAVVATVMLILACLGRHQRPNLGKSLVFYALAEHDGDDREVAVTVGMNEVHFHSERFALDHIFAG